MKRAWLLLSYKIPNEPSKHRVFVWRKLKRLGAELLHDTFWCLPATDWTREQFQWLTIEIKDFGGSAYLFESQLTIPGQDDTLVQTFLTKVETEYRDILKELEQEELDLMTISKRYQMIQKRDYFQSELGKNVRDALITKGRT
ncbi:ChrB protein [Paenibacillus antri]|uniref:ChrB protein n=1 Tax=Paenibacillus antri TaxID=2582848 RepID=A0A5R9G3C2_9BACL|nr:Chromate resistance protein ChrB [Paenibacillus antri]TLS48796.1 ChrB protein [Paenibacillus antri]